MLNGLLNLKHLIRFILENIEILEKRTFAFSFAFQLNSFLALRTEKVRAHHLW